MCAALAEPPLPFLCINVESSRERLQWQREQSATFGVSVVPNALPSDSSTGLHASSLAPMPCPPALHPDATNVAYARQIFVASVLPASWHRTP